MKKEQVIAIIERNIDRLIKENLEDNAATIDRLLYDAVNAFAMRYEETYGEPDFFTIVEKEIYMPTINQIHEKLKVNLIEQFSAKTKDDQIKRYIEHYINQNNFTNIIRRDTALDFITMFIAMTNDYFISKESISLLRTNFLNNVVAGFYFKDENVSKGKYAPDEMSASMQLLVADGRYVRGTLPDIKNETPIFFNLNTKLLTVTHEALQASEEALTATILVAPHQKLDGTISLIYKTDYQDKTVVGEITDDMLKMPAGSLATLFHYDCISIRRDNILLAITTQHISFTNTTKTSWAGKLDEHYLPLELIIEEAKMYLAIRQAEQKAAQDLASAIQKIQNPYQLVDALIETPLSDLIQRAKLSPVDTAIRQLKQEHTKNLKSKIDAITHAYLLLNDAIMTAHDAFRKDVNKINDNADAVVDSLKQQFQQQSLTLTPEEIKKYRKYTDARILVIQKNADDNISNIEQIYKEECQIILNSHFKLHRHETALATGPSPTCSSHDKPFVSQTDEVSSACSNTAINSSASESSDPSSIDSYPSDDDISHTGEHSPIHGADAIAVGLSTPETLTSSSGENVIPPNTVSLSMQAAVKQAPFSSKSTSHLSASSSSLYSQTSSRSMRALPEVDLSDLPIFVSSV